MVSSPDPHAHIDRHGSRRGRAVSGAKDRLARWLGRLAALCLTPRGLLAADVRAALWNAGVAAQPAGFYASLVDPTDVPIDRRSRLCPAVDFAPETQRKYLTEVFPRYQAEYLSLASDRPTDWTSRPRFFLRNDAFQNLDPLAYWGMVRHHRPRRIVELGSGFSTLVAAQAVEANGHGDVVAIDPYPREFIRRNDLRIQVITEPAERVDPSILLSLRANDIVFVDTSHVVRSGGDVTWFFLEILPQLAEGVLVHIHDIHLPFDYPRTLISDRNVYWTEQYLLHAYLVKNTTDEVLFGSRYAATSFTAECRAAFPRLETIDGASFWMRVSHRSPQPRAIEHVRGHGEN